VAPTFNLFNVNGNSGQPSLSLSNDELRDQSYKTFPGLE
jgi:hypothetical protein